MDNLDAEWAAEHPPVPTDKLEFEWMGARLMRLQEIPVEAWLVIEHSAATENVVPLVRAIRMSLNATCHAAFDEAMGDVTHSPEGDTIRRPGLTDRRISQLWQYLVRQATGRPTQQPPASSNGPSPTGTSSTDGSSTQEAEWGSEGTPVAAS